MHNNVLNIALIDVAFWWMLFAINCSDPGVVNLRSVINVVRQNISYANSNGILKLFWVKLVVKTFQRR